MVAIVTGKGTGLERSSAFVLGSQGQIGSAALGRDGEGVYVNAANGNLIITRQDEFLIGLGSDISASRTYNSQGLTDGDNNDGWRASAYRTVTGLSGTYGAAGTTVTRTDWDGSATVYTWDAAYVTPENVTGAYVAKDGSGAYDTLTRGGTTWTWFDGSTKLKETYNETNGGRIASAVDTDNNLVDYTFDGNGRIATVKTYNLAGTGDDELVTYSYTGANLTQIVTSKNGGASTLTRVRYAYETYDSGTKTRLTGVTVDLSPNDNSVGDTYAYTTSYTYKNDTSALVASISQTDGSLIQIQYDGSNRVSLFTQTIAAGVTRTTSFDYASGGRTIITDPAGQKTVMVYDVATSDLLQISYPPDSNNAPARTVQFAYNANGDIKSVAHGPGNVVTYEYDTHGNRTLDRDSAGNTVERTFSNKNELRRETHYLVADPDGAGAGTPSSAVTSRYAYDDKSHLRFEVSAEGFVTENRYDNEGRRTVTIAYAGTAYDVSALAPTALIERGPLETWVTNLATKANALRTERTYDFRGNLTKVTSHEILQADGTFLTTSAKTETLYVYDQTGLLLQRTVTNPQAAGTLTESFVYDGLNRMTLATDFYSNVTRTTFLDNRSQTVVTHANGLSKITTFNRGGEIISSSTSNAGANLVDLAGWPGNTQSPPGGNASVPGWLNYGDFINETAWATTTGPDGLPVVAMRTGQTDAALEGGGNFTNEIEIDGAKTYEFTYYFKFSDLNKHAIYFGLSQGAYVEFASTGVDEGNPYFFSAGHTGQEATFTADTWYKVVGYVLPQGAAAPAAPLGGVYNVETGAKVANATTFRWNAERANNSVHSRFFNYYGEANQQYSSYFYQPEIRQVTVPGVPAPDIQTRQYRYDNLGRLRLTVDPTGRREFFLYDTANRRVANVDNDGTVTEYRYDGNDNVTSTTRYNNRLTALQLDALEFTDQPITLNPTASSMVSNGSFETSGSYTTITDGRSNTTLPGWTDANSTPFEQITSGHLGVNASNGAYWLDLDSLASNGYTATGSNLLNNGSVDTSGTYTTIADGRSNTTLPGWTDANGAPFEQITSGNLGVNASNGPYWLDMDSRVNSGYAPTGSTLLTNGSFDTSGSYTTIANGRSNTTLPGWIDANGRPFEQITSGQLGVNASNGAYWLDMDSLATAGYTATGSNLLTNGSFETSAGSYTTLSTGRSNPTLPGWVDAHGYAFEQVTTGELGVNASNGTFWLDLDGVSTGLVPTGPNLVQNGSFETSASGYTTTDTGRVQGMLPGWGSPKNPALYEQVTSGELGVNATDGDFWLDLDGYHEDPEVGANKKLWQNFTLLGGSTMMLQFDHANRTDSASGSFEVYWNGSLVSSINSTGTNMTTETLVLTAAAGTNVLEFRPTGTADQVGASLDNVRLFHTTPTGGANMEISQTVGGRTAGEIMEIKFDHANRTSSASGSFEVYWNNTLIDTITSTSLTMQTKTYQLAAVAGNNTLRFKSLGTVDSTGASIDNVRLFATTPNLTGGNMDISQTVSGRTAGEVMQIQFDTANRTTSASGSFEVYWNNTLIDTVTSTGTTMQPKTYQVTAVAGNNTLRFKGLGTADSAGASIDNVLLFATAPIVSGGNMDISQTVSGRTAGEIMEIKFDTANRTTSASGSLEVYWNNTLIDTITSTGTTMQTKTYQVAAVAGNNTLRFKSIGTVDGAGASLDNIRLFATTPNITGANMDISQAVTGLIAGQVMQLKFDHANRTTSGSGSFEVYWNSALVATINSTGTTMTTETLNLTAIAGANILRFKGTGTVDSNGASLDNVRLVAMQQVSAPLLGLADIRPLADPANDVWTFNVYDAAQRLVQTIDGLGATKVLSYDGASRLVSTKSYANRVSAANLDTLKARETSPNYWANANNGAWGVGNLSITAAGTVDGANAYQLSVITGGAWNGLVGNPIEAVAYDATTVTLSLKAVGGISTAEFGIYSSLSVWGGNSESSAVVLSGPGAVMQHAGSLFYISGLSTTEATRITISRSFAQSETLQPYLYIKTTDYTVVAAGDSLIAAAPVQTFSHGSAVFLPTADSANDRVARSFYDNDGRLTGTLDSEGYLATTVYDKAGRQIETIGYAAATNPALRASGTLAQLVSGLADNAKDAHNWLLYDARGLVRASVDSEGGLTRMSYNPLGELAYVETGQKLDPLALIATPPTLANLPAAPSGTVLQTVNYVRDAYNHVVSETRSLTGAATTTTAYSYDNMYRLAATTTQSGGPDTRVMRQRYDLRGNVIGRLNGIGSAALAALGGSPTQAQIDAVWADLGTTLTYDRADRLLYSTDPNGNRILYYYDTDGRLGFEIDPLGQVTGHVYDSHGRQTQAIVYDSPLTSLSGMNGGDVTAGLLSAIAAIASASDTSAFTAYNADDTVKQVTDPNGVVTAITYNGFRETATRIEASGTGIARTTTYAYDRRGLLKTQVVDAGIGSHRNITTTYGYDAFGRAVTLTNALNKVATSTYDRKGRLKTQTVSPNGGATLYTTTYHYDARDNLVAVTDASGATTRNVYDKAGRRIATIDARGGVTTITYDADGRAVATRAYATLLAGVGALPTEVTETALSLPSTNAADHVTRFSYDKDGRLRFTIDGLMHATETVYDQNGNVIRTIAYDGTIAPADYLEATVATAVSALAAAAGNRTTRAVYDSANRAVYAIDALGQVMWSKYDRKGQLVKQVEVATLYTTSGDPSKSAMDGWLATYANPANDRTTRAYYDKAGQLLYSIDALGFVTRFEYDSLGNVSKQWRYPDTYPALDTTTVANLNAAFASPPAETRLTQFGYDTAGRLEQTIDPENFVTKLTLDAMGHVLTSTAAFGTGAASTTAHTYDDVGRMVKQVHGSGAPEASTNWFYYDGVGRQTGFVDPGNYLSVLAYDEVGNMLTETHYANAITAAFDGNTLVTALQALAGTNAADTQSATAYDAFGRVTTATDARGSVVSNGYDVLDRLLNQNQQMEAGSGDDRITVYAYDNFGNVEWATDPRGYQSHTIFDKLNRVVRQSNALYYHTDTTYSRGGQVASVKVWATGAAGHLALGTNPSSAAGDAVTTFTYNKRDELTATTDAMSYTESYTLNAFGERTELRNKLHVAGTFDTTVLYTYDKRGLLLTETLPITTKTSGGATINVVNSYSYDARGNRTQMIEAAGAAEARTTGYTYDKLGRLTVTTHDSVTVVNANLTSSTNVPVVETAVYDTRGNVIKTTDTAGAQSFFYRDHLGRVIAEIGPAGALSVYGYDKNGNRTSVRAYDAAVALPGSPGGAPPSGSGTSRLVTYAYDRSNRLTTTTVSGLQTGEYAAGAWSFSSTDVVSTIEYDMAGNVIHQEDGRGSDVYFWYDQGGRQIAQIDAENYLTIYQRDAEGNAVAETRFASKITGSFTTATPAYGGLLALVTANNALDRTTTFTYDANGRRTSERRWYVDASTVSVTGALGTSSQTAIIQFSYDGLGNVLTRTEANSDQTSYAYDKIGRLVLETGQSFTDHQGASVAPRTAYAYDGLNNVRSIRLQAASTPNDTNDRSTTYTYGAGGRIATITDAAGFVHTYGYDVAGRMVRDSYIRTKSDGSSVTEAQVMRYDIAGRAITQTLARDTGSGWVFTNEAGAAYDAVRMDYNVHGEMIGRGLTAGPDAAAVYQETFSYDLGGRLWKSNEGDGVLRFFVYDKAGNKTLALASTGDDLSGLTASTYTNSINGTGDTSLGASVTTIATFDKRGQQLSLIEPDRQRTASGTAAITRSNTYNAFGEVLTEVDGRGYTTTFTYNTMGRLSSKVSPQVSITAENGAVSNATPTENYYYDISGRMVGVRDANAIMDAAIHTTTRLLLAGSGHGKDAEPLVIKEFHADYNGTTGAVVTKYDVFGDARAQINELGSTETRDFDKMGRLVVQYHPVRAVGSMGNPTGVAVQLIDYYAYDGLGQRIQHWNSQFTEYFKERTDYDAHGRVVSSVAFDGGTFTYTYAWNGGLTTSGMSAWGGWTKVTTNVAAARSMTDVEDYFHHTIDQVDYGGHDYAFTYDWGGRLIARSNVSGESIGYSWYNTGLAAGQTGTQGTASYEYDANGNRTKETFSKGGISYRNANATYDAMGRMTHWDDSGYGGYAPASSDWQYDAVGNVRSVSSNYRALDSQGNIAGSGTPQTYWYLYDNMNRFTLTKGTLTGTPGSGTIERGSEGTLISYYADGSRATALYTGQVYYTHWELTNPGGPPILPGPIEEGGGGETGYVWAPVTTTGPGDRREDYFYTADGYLAETRHADAWVDPGPDPSTNGGVPGEPVYHGPPAVGSLVSQTTRDALGRVTWYKEYGGFDGSFERTGISYDYAGRQLGETNFTIRRDTPGAISSTYKTISANYYSGGVLTKSTQDTYKWDNGDNQYKDSAVDDSLQIFSYSWWDGAVQSSIGNDKNWGGNPNSYSIDWTTAFTLDGSGHVSSVYIDDGRNRTVSFAVDQNGQIAHRDEDDNTSGGDPRTLRYFFGGQQLGMVTNNGTDNLQYTTAVKDRLLPLATSDTQGAFRNGSKTAKPYADFEQSYDAINGYAQDDTASAYTIHDGDTLQSIALAIWGDSSLWYLIADANGLSNDSQLVQGQSISLPNKIRNNKNSADTFRPYDPNEALGNLSPTSPKPTKKPKCAVVGQILMIAIAVAVSVVTAGAAAAAMGAASSVLGGIGALASGVSAISGAALAATTTIAAGAIGGAIGSIASQAFGVATGLQNKFSWKGVAMAAVSGAISGGMGPGKLFGAGGAFSGLGTSVGAKMAAGALRGIVSSGLGQGIGVATGLQKKFDWAGVAAAGVGGAVSAGIGAKTEFWNKHASGLVSGGAAAIASSATRSIIDGSDFGDNLLAALPDVIGTTLGNMLVDGISGNSLFQSRRPVISVEPAPVASSDASQFNGQGGPDEEAQAGSVPLVTFSGDQPGIPQAQWIADAQLARDDDPRRIAYNTFVSFGGSDAPAIVGMVMDELHFALENGGSFSLDQARAHTTRSGADVFFRIGANLPAYQVQLAQQIQDLVPQILQAQANGEDTFDLYHRLQPAMNDYALASTDVYDLRRSGMAGNPVFAPQLNIAEAYRRGADLLAADQGTDDRDSFATAITILRKVTTPGEFRDLTTGLITLASLQFIDRNMMPAQNRANLVQGVSFNTVHTRNAITDRLVGSAEDLIYYHSRLPIDVVMSSMIPAADRQAFEYGQQAAFGLHNLANIGPFILPSVHGMMSGIRGLMGRFGRSRLFGVVNNAEMRARDIAGRAYNEEVGFVTNPNARRLDSMLSPSNNIVNKSNGRTYMYVVDRDGNIIVGTRSGERMPHPTLIGGHDPQVRAAGMLQVRGGKILRIDNDSGHFRPDTESLNAARAAFSRLPREAFSPNFEGYHRYTPR
jgi:YD repeat-containing protein